MGIVFALVIVAFVAFVLWRGREQKKNIGSNNGADNYTPPDNRDVDRNP